VSLLLKSELRLRLGPRGCDAGLWSAGLSARCVGRASSADDADIEQVLDALAAQGHDLPRSAKVCVEDEFLYYALLPAAGRWRAAQARAREHFAAASGDHHLLVETSLLPDGRSWVAVAIGTGLVDRVRSSLAARDVELRGLSAALLDDLAALRGEHALELGVIVLLRSEGATMVGLQDGVLADIAWERCDLAEPESIATRVRGYRARFAQQVGLPHAAGDLPVLALPANAAQQALLGPVALAQGWRVLSPASGAQS
jgi:hypothetical protein